ncbi:MAG: SDR family NAD(P)-dependent oxidoreductase, partial [Sulfurimonas sp.]|nr:SDR family NAD(P)-dependent oxidoreductase [Sulfurimonas sp.]
MKKVVVTGASSGIGKEITNRLLKLGYAVIGISRSIKKEDFNNENFTSLPANLSDETSVLNTCKTLTKEDIYM